MVNITIPLGPGDDLASSLTHLFGSDARDYVWGQTSTDKSNTQSDAQGDNVVPGPTTVPGIFTQDWLNAHWHDFIVWAIVLVCIVLGIGLATRH